jgi:eukaryotic-like serine/threonine-protein kinase
MRSTWGGLGGLVWVVAAVMVVTAVTEPLGWLLEGRYQLRDRIATGGMGEVWRARDLVLGRPVAVKLLRPGYADHEGLARFRAEARQAGSLSHPGIARVYDYCEADPPYPPYLVMELVDGPSLARLLEDGPVGPAWTMSLIAQAARALAAAHAADLVHRDIKPGNLLVSCGGQVKITDFGIARKVGSAALTRPGVLMGTAAYLAPERASGASAGPAADLYALGIVAYQCLTGRLPFHGEPLAVALAHQQQPLPPLPPTLPAAVAALVTDLTAKDPAARPASADEVAERAEHVRATLTATAATPHHLSARARAATVTDITSPAGPPPGRHTEGGTRQRRQSRRSGARLPVRAALALAAIAALAVAAIAAMGWMLPRGQGPASPYRPTSPASVTQQSSPRANHGTHRAVPARRRGGSAAQAPGQDRQSAASSKPPTPSATPTPSRRATPTQSPTPTGNPTPAGSPTPSVTLTSTGSGTLTNTPTTNTPTTSGTLTAVPSASVSPTSSPAAGAA